jgi:hypothetical protein
MQSTPDTLDRLSESLGRQLGLTLDLADDDPTVATLTVNGEPLVAGTRSELVAALRLMERLLRLSADYAGDDPF